MFGFVVASLQELSEEEKNRYQAVYCGICRAIRDADGQLCRLGLSYDMAFLALLLTSLYEPEEQNGSGRCIAHPAKRRPWADNEYIRYAARMNVALAVGVVALGAGALILLGILDAIVGVVDLLHLLRRVFVPRIGIRVVFFC